ncbi:MAG: ferritin family protein [Desulfobacterales bacterium]
MPEGDTIDILKQAILLERRGKTFYENVAEKAENKAVREVFDMLAKEEEKHIQTLSEQFNVYHKKKKFIHGSLQDKESSVASKVLTREIKEKISAAGFEAAAISAGIAMEERAIELYAKSAQTASDPVAKSLYEWLATWERDHLNMLLDIDDALKEKIWFDNRFWPF